MGRIISIGNQSFRDVIEKGYFYIDKTGFIKEWWESGDVVTLITRPRRFGKTMNMNMLESFFSVREPESKELFQGLSIWKEEKYRKLQGTYPVISLSFANVKERNYEDTVYQICQLLMMEYEKYGFLLESNLLSDTEKQIYKRTMENLEEKDASLALYRLSDYISRYYRKNLLIFLDDKKSMNRYINNVALATFSCFDSGKKASESEPERFYHGFAFCGKKVLIG